jgi:hypothetical protein
MKFFTMPSSLSRFSLKKRRELKEFQKELDRPVRVSRYSASSYPGEIPKVISFQTISTTMDASTGTSRLDASLPTLGEGMDLSDRSVLHW